MKTWNFQAVVKFPVEVDESYFLTEELGDLRISIQGIWVSISNVSFNVEHPVTGGPQTGTQLLINLTAETRR